MKRYCINCGVAVILLDDEWVDGDFESPYCRQSFSGVHEVNEGEDDDNE